MDYDGYERRPPHAPGPLSHDEEHRVAAARNEAERRRSFLEQKARNELQQSAHFTQRLSAHQIEDEQTKELILDAAARDVAQHLTTVQQLHPTDVGRLIEGAIAEGLVEKERLDREQRKAHIQQLGSPASPSEQTQREQPEHQSAERLAQPEARGQWPGKYRELDELSGERADELTPQQAEEGDKQPTPDINPVELSNERAGEVMRQPEEESDKRRAPDVNPVELSNQRADEIARQQADESTKRQTLTPESPGQRREPTDEEHKAASIEQTDRKLDRSDRNEVTDDLARRRDALMRKFGHEFTDRDGPHNDRGRGR
jgi:hypothetical protein